MEKEISVGWRRIIATYLHISKLISVVFKCVIIDRTTLPDMLFILWDWKYRLSLVSLQIAGWFSADNFEKSV